MTPNTLRFLMLCLIAGYFAFTFWGQTPTSAAPTVAPTGQSAHVRAQPPGEPTGRSALLPGGATGQTAHMRGTCTARIKSVALAESGRSDRANLPVAATGGVTLRVTLDGIASRVRLASPNTRFQAAAPEVCSSGVCEIPASAGGPYTVQLDDCPPLVIRP